MAYPDLPHAVREALALAAAELARVGAMPMNAEQVEDFETASRFDEVLDLLDHWKARLGFAADVADRISTLLADVHGRGDADSVE